MTIAHYCVQKVMVTYKKQKDAPIWRILTNVCRKEATRTPDPYVPNVVRYQLRYFPKTMNLAVTDCKSTYFPQQHQIFDGKM